MPKITHVKSARQRYERKPVIGPSTGKTKVVPVNRTARTGNRITFECAEPGCPEVETYTHDFRRDEVSMRNLRRQIPFRCVRHKNPERYMKPGNEATRHVLVATAGVEPMPGHKPHLSWRAEGGSSGSSIASGPGFYADANEFPEGTRLVVTAQIEMPAEAAEPVTAAKEQNQ